MTYTVRSIQSLDKADFINSVIKDQKEALSGEKEMASCESVAASRSESQERMSHVEGTAADWLGSARADEESYNALLIFIRRALKSPCELLSGK